MGKLRLLVAQPLGAPDVDGQSGTAERKIRTVSRFEERVCGMVFFCVLNREKIIREIIKNSVLSDLP